MYTESFILIVLNESFRVKRSRKKDFPQHKFTAAYLSDEDEEFEIKLTYDYDHGGKYSMGMGFSHFVLTVPDLRNSYITHKKMGYKVTNLKNVPGEKPICYFLTDPDGYKIQVIRD